MEEKWASERANELFHGRKYVTIESKNALRSWNQELHKLNGKQNGSSHRIGNKLLKNCMYKENMRRGDG